MRPSFLALAFLAACGAPADKSDTDVPTEDTDGIDTDVAAVDTDVADTDVVDTDPLPGDPPVPAAPCGTDLQVHNGTTVVDLGLVGSPGAYTFDPVGDGAYDTIVQNLQVDNPTAGRGVIPVSIFAPSTDGTTAAAGSYPLVLFFPGFGTSHTSYTHFTRKLASHGFIVIGASFPNTGFLDPAHHDLNALEGDAVISWALTTGPYADLIDATKIATMGHSQGGKIAFYVATLDPRVDMVIGLDPQNGGGPPCAVAGTVGANCNAWPVAPNCRANDSGLESNLHAETLVFAAEDKLITPDAHLRAIHFYRGAPSVAHLVHMPSVGHASWVTDTATSQVTRRVATSLLLTRFGGWTGLEQYLPEGTYLDGVASVSEHTTK